MPNMEMFVDAMYHDRQKETLIAALTAATVDAITVPADSVRIMLTEVPAGNFGVGGKTGQAASRLAIIQALLIAGRSDTQKNRLVAALTDAAVAALGVEAALVRVIIKDVPNTDFGIAGQTAKALGRGIGRAEMAAPAPPG
jgi:4-oxalocrotonate tautomerase